MAIFHLNVKTVSRGSGGSAGSSYDYLNRDGKYAKDKDEVLTTSSGNMPGWIKGQPGEYWRTADVYERANARLCKRIEFALPRELDQDAQKKLADDFARQLTDTNDGPLPYSYAIHKGHGQGNPHCHLVISERVNDGQVRSREDWFKRANQVSPAKGGAKKTTALMPREWLTEARVSWQNQANMALDRAGHDTRIDHRTLEAQGIDRVPGKHRGVALNAMLNKGKLEQQEVEKNIQPDSPSKEAVQQKLQTALQDKNIMTGSLDEVKSWFQKEKKSREIEARIQQRHKIEQEKIQKEKAAQEQERKVRRSQGMSR